MNWPIELQAPSCKHLELDRSLDQGYSRIKKKEKRTYAKLNASRPRTVVTRRIKPARARNWQPRTRVTHPLSSHKLQASSITLLYLGSKLQAPSLLRYKPQASSPKQQASSSKPQASSSMILEPRNI